MVKSSTLDTQEIESMMQRINSVPITDTLNMQIIRLDKANVKLMFPERKNGMEFLKHFMEDFSRQLQIVLLVGRF